jgi:hypothetical protein
MARGEGAQYITLADPRTRRRCERLGRGALAGGEASFEDVAAPCAKSPPIGSRIVLANACVGRRAERVCSPGHPLTSARVLDFRTYTRLRLIL